MSLLRVTNLCLFTAEQVLRVWDVWHYPIPFHFFEILDKVVPVFSVLWRVFYAGLLKGHFPRRSHGHSLNITVFGIFVELDWSLFLSFFGHFDSKLVIGVLEEAEQVYEERLSNAAIGSSDLLDRQLTRGPI